MDQIVIISIFLILSFMLPLNCRTRKPAVSGRWYSSDPQELQAEIKDYLGSVELSEKQKSIEPAGIIVPHAGYIFSAPVAAYSYKLLEGKSYDTVIIIGSSHHYLQGIVSVYQGSEVETPLGNLAVDGEIVDSLLADSNDIVFSEAVHVVEHSNEAQFPFIKYLLPDVQVVSILTSTQDKKILKQTAERLYSVISQSDKRFLLICSTDMSHYHSYDEAKKIDRRTIDTILKEKWEELDRDINRTHQSELCGYKAFYIFQSVLSKLQVSSPELLCYANSGDVKPEYGLDQVVGYSAIVFPAQGNRKQKPANTGHLTTKETRKWLLGIARQSISSHLTGESDLLPVPEDERLLEERAVFVTLHKRGQLRGCIGHMTARDQLYRAVWQMARSAAFEDPRFGSVNRSELSEIEIEISILTPMQKIDSIDEIVMGRDGVMVQQGYHSGVYLPQVARETGWDKETFLQSLCSSKAFLPPKAYLDPQTDIYIFQVEEFSEKE